MKIDPKRYDTDVARSCAVGPTDIAASICSFFISQGFNISSDNKAGLSSRISVEALIDFPEKFMGHKLLVEIKGVEEFQAWNDIDPDHQCIGNLRWFEKNTFHISAHISLEAIKNISELLQHSKLSDRLSLHFGATAIGMESLEFQNDEIQKGLALTDVHCFLKGTIDKSVD